MRIAIVSAHYPPNFVSGGTLVPQRIAATLAARGHQVFVFAGELLPGEPDLTVRVERTAAGTDGPGIEITWVSSNGFIGWGDDRNHSNPGMETAFLDFLRRVRPDVVHLHTLQGVGAGLVPLAAASGAATVVTMHDMWWWCARQFLVQELPDGGLRPCSSVVDCGICPCSVDETWRRRRNGVLADRLAAADLVLAPSAPMLDLLRANGVAPDRLALDENPAPDEVRSAPAGLGDRGPIVDTDRSSPTLAEGGRGRQSGVEDGRPNRAATRQSPPRVRFVFAGGRYPVKGGPLALAAARLLADVDGWSLDLYGVEHRGALSARIRVLPPYPADTASTVLAGYDVLVMSSVMLESYSLLTREALAAGCAVITGDNPGPMEVIRDGVNGLVVPRGDAPALAAAMRRLVTEPELLHRLRPEPGLLSLRSLDEQAEGLLAHYDRIRAGYRAAHSTSAATDRAVAGTAEADTDRASADPAEVASNPPSTAPSKLPALQRVVLLTGIDGAPLRYRGHLPAEALAGVGVHLQVLHYRDAAAAERALAADAVVMYRVPATDQILELLAAVRALERPVPILFDVDDLIVDPGVAPQLDPVLTAAGVDLELYWQGVRRYRTTLEACDAYIGSTDRLCEQIGRLTGMPTHRFANGVGRELARASDAALRRPVTDKGGEVRVGYFSGTNTHNEDWAFIEPAIVALLTARPQVRLVLGGLLEPSDALREHASRITRLPFTPWYDLPSRLRDLDVNLAPLAPATTFNEAKSAIKWLEAALVAVPTVASPTQPFREAIAGGVSGLLASDTAGWLTALTALVDDEALRTRIGARAREQALLTLSPAQQGHRYRRILLDARDDVARLGHRVPSGWPAETLSEPAIPVQLEFYGSLDIDPSGRIRPAAQRGVRELVGTYRTAARDMLAEQGVLATARRAVAVARRLRRSGLARLRSR